MANKTQHITGKTKEEPLVQLRLDKPHKPAHGMDKKFPVVFNNESWGRFLRKFSRILYRFEFQTEDYMKYPINKFEKSGAKAHATGKKTFFIGWPRIFGFSRIVRIEGRITPDILKILKEEGLKSTELKLYSKDKLIAEAYDHGAVAYLYA